MRRVVSPAPCAVPPASAASPTASSPWPWSVLLTARSLFHNEIAHVYSPRASFSSLWSCLTRPKLCRLTASADKLQLSGDSPRRVRIDVDRCSSRSAARRSPLARCASARLIKLIPSHGCCGWSANACS